MRLLLIILLLLPLQKAYAQAKFVSDTTSVIEVRAVAADKMAGWKNSKAFRYDRNESKLSWLSRLKMRFWQWLHSFFSNENNERGFWIGLLSICAIVIAFAVYKLSGMNRSGMFERRDREGKAYTEGEENIHEIDFADEIKKAEQSGNLRLAVRLRYLQLLKFLSDKGLIRWQPNKTNHAYIAEMQAAPWFADITNSFEYIWYGEHGIDTLAYENIKSKFEQQQKASTN